MEFSSTFAALLPVVILVVLHWTIWIKLKVKQIDWCAFIINWIEIQIVIEKNDESLKCIIDKIYMKLFYTEFEYRLKSRDGRQPWKSKSYTICSNAAGWNIIHLCNTKNILHLNLNIWSHRKSILAKSFPLFIRNHFALGKQVYRKVHCYECLMWYDAKLMQVRIFSTLVSPCEKNVLICGSYII